MLTIGELCEVVNGGTPKTGIDEYWNGKHLWITPAEMGKRESPYVFETERRITDAGLRNSSARLLPPNSVILSSRAPIGHLVINTEPMAFNQGCKGLVPGPSIHHKYLFYYLSSIVDLLNALGTGATFKELSGGKLKEVIVPVPPLAEQKRIVAILDEAFEGIRIATANAEKNLANARDLFDAELRCLFEESAQSYPMLALENLTERITKGSSPKWQGISYVTDGGILFVTSENVGQNRMLLDEPKFVDARFNEKDRKSILRRDDVLTNIVGASIGRTAVFESDDVANINQAVCLIRCKTDALLPRFLSALLNSDYFRRQLFANTTDTARANLSLAFFRSFEIPVPPIEVQQRIIEDVLSIQLECDALSMRYQEKCNGVSELKQSILSRAFSGQLTATKGLAA
ncbi:MAG TPA: restriction endonuclease subunit S [Opitutus sp.]|nr:restriction endonuclease subunit S [Opitutus sp.]